MDFLWPSRFSTTVFWLIGFLLIFYILKWLFIKKGKSIIKFFISLLISISIGIKNNPDIRSFFRRHPALAGFLKRRLNPLKFSGLTLTVLLLISAYAVTSFVSIAIDVFIIGNAVNVDLSLANLLHDFRNPLLVKIFLWATLLGNWRIILAMVLVILALFWLWNKKNYIAPFLIGVGGSFLTGIVGTYLWQRPRPMDVAVYI